MKLKAPRFPLWQIFILCLMLFPAAGCVIAEPSLIESASENEGGNHRRNSSRGTGECDRNRRCENICESLFTTETAREKCEALDIIDVEQMEETVRVLENPDWEKLEALDLNVLSALLKISLNPMETAIGRMIPEEKNLFLEWLVIKPNTAKTLEDGEDNLEILKELIGSSKHTILHDLNRTISGRESFMTLAIEVKNELVLKWIHGLFEHICNGEKCVFQDFYCQLSLDSEEEEALFHYDFFARTLNEMLSSHRPEDLDEDHWWKKTDTDAEDLNRWRTSPHNVCECLKGGPCPDEED
ncbi:MAG: hypothetical protein OXB86_06395 [Bdellovibrionales bacterium]|nr:hypothetical protein [Bdellovibrionales bacterium]